MTRLFSLSIVMVCLLAGVVSAAAQTPVDEGYRDFSFGTTANSTPTGEKPESKLWFADGSWWGSLFSTQAGAYHIYRFDSGSQSWTDTGTAIDPRPGSKADALWDETLQKLYVASHLFTSSGSATTTVAQWARLYRYSYESTSNTYTLDAGFPVNISRGRAEALTIAKDGAGRLWTTYVEGSKVKINWSGVDDATWGTPVDLPAPAIDVAVNSDDISAIVALANGSVGVMWSNQRTKRTSFMVHNAADPPTTWQPIEVVLPAGACTSSCSDDHISLRSDQSGRVFAATKTSTDSSGEPEQMLAVRSAAGVWALHVVGVYEERLTRAILLLDETQQMVYVVATNPESGGEIHIKSSSMNGIDFSAPSVAIIKSDLDDRINNPTSTKQNLSSATGMLVLASDQESMVYLHAFLPLGGGEPPAPPSAPVNLAATALSASRIRLDWTDTANNESGFQIERKQGTGNFAPVTTVGANVTTFEDAGLTLLTQYTYRVRAENGLGVSAFTNDASATTTGAGSGGNLKAISFENGSLTHPTTGADAVIGTVTIESTAPIKGGFSARIANGSSSLEENFTPASNFYASFYVRLQAIPTSDARIVLVTNSGSTIGNILLRSTGQLRLRNSSTTIGADSAPLTVGSLYRIGLRQRAGTGGNGVLEAFLANGDDDFGSPFASTLTGAWTSSANRVRVGPTTSNAVNAVFDDIRLDSNEMPAPSTGASTPPVAPQDPAGFATSPTEVHLQWVDAANNETAIHIERKDASGNFAPIASLGPNATSYDDTGLTPATTYVYRLRGENNGAFSEYSDLVSVTTPSNTPGPPSAPSNLDAVAQLATHVTLSWSDNSDNEVTFHVERADSSLVFAQIGTAPGNATGYSDETTAGSTVYNYRVRASNAGGFSAFSNVDQVTTPAPLPQPPAPPTGLSATPTSSTQVRLAWTDASSNETFFEIFRGAGPGDFGTLHANVPGNTTFYDDISLTPNTTYSYYVRAGNEQGVSVFSNEAVATTPASGGTPGEVKAITFEGGTLTHPTTGADQVIGSGVFLESAAPVKGSLSARIAGTSTYLEESFAAENDLYLSFYLRLNSIPTSDARLVLISNSGTTVGNLILRTTGQLRLRNGSTSIGADSAALAVGTTYRVGVHQRSDAAGSAVLEAFLMTGDAATGAPFSSTASGTWTTPADRVRIGATTSTVDVVVDDIKLNRLSMPGPSGGGEPSSPPTAPTNLTAAATSASTIELNWTPGANAASLHVERSGPATGFAEAAVLNPDATSHIDIGLTPSTPYTYRVRAQNAAGFSEYSAVAGATTLPPGSASPIKAITFENGSLTHADTGVDAITGTVTLESAAPLKGAFSARINTASSFVEERFAATGDFYASFYLRLDALPAGDVRLVLVSNSGSSVGNILLRSTGHLRLRANSTTVGADSAALAVGQLYRIGIRQQAGAGANAVLEAFLATADTAFGTPFAATNAGTWTTSADRLRVGMTATAVANVVVDEIRLDASTMPGPTP